MYSEGDLQDAIAAGIIPPETAEAFRNHVASIRSAPMVDEEHFRLLTGFNDIFVSIACVILFVAIAWIGASVGGAGTVGQLLPGLLVAVTSWGLSEYFTRQRHMALPSILLLCTFVGGIGFAVGLPLTDHVIFLDNVKGSLAFAGVAAVTAAAAWCHWRRFKVPITIAAGSAALAGVVIALLLSVLPDLVVLKFGVLLVAGLCIFAFAMYWDMSDLSRTTRRSDVAFWLHLTAAPMIAHSLFNMLGVFNGGDVGAGKAVIVIALYIAFGIVALAIDRRALLVSSLAYVLYALYALFERAGAVELSAAFTALVIGSSLLLLSALWHHARAIVVNRLPPSLRARLPYLERSAAA